MRAALIFTATTVLGVTIAVAQQPQGPARKPLPPASLITPTPGAPQPNQGERGTPQQPSNAETRGTEDRPVVVKVLPTEKTAAERSQEQRDRGEKSASDRWMVRLTAILAIVGIGQGIVFAIQAIQLRRSVNLTRTVANQQQQDMAASIAEASRAAKAMEGVANAMSENVANTRELLERQRQFAIMQMRAYIFVQTGDILNVANPAQPIPEGQPLPKGAITRTDCGPIIIMTMRNAGNTPANNVVHVTNAVFRKFPLTAPLPDFAEVPQDSDLMSVFSLPPGGIGTKNWVFPVKLHDQEVEQLRNATAAIYVYGRITYTDIFGVERVTNYRYRHNGHSGIVGVTGELTGTRQGNDFT
jgi:hypothetical protein